eukprot:403358420
MSEIQQVNLITESSLQTQESGIYEVQLDPRQQAKIKYTLKIQHWFFNKRFNQQPVKKVAPKIQEVTSQKQKSGIAAPSQITTSTKPSKINGSNRLPKAAEKHLQKYQQEANEKLLQDSKTQGSQDQEEKPQQSVVSKVTQKPPVVKQSAKTTRTNQPINSNGFVRVTESSKTVLISEEKFVIEKDENNNEKVIQTEKHNFKATKGTQPLKQPMRKNSSTAAMVIDASKTEQPTVTTVQEGKNTTIVTSTRTSGRQTTRPQSNVEPKDMQQPSGLTRKPFQRAPSAKAINQPDQQAETKSTTSSVIENKPELADHQKKHAFKSARNTTGTRLNTAKTASTSTLQSQTSIKTEKTIVDLKAAQDIKSPRTQPSHTPLIGGQKTKDLTKPQIINRPATAKEGTSVQHFKKWGERTNSWKPAEFESVQALVEKGWQEAEELKDSKKQHSRRPSAARHTGPALKEVIEEKQVQGMVEDVWQKAEEIKKQRQEEREKAKQRSKSKSGLAKPKWGERQTSWKAADFDSVQALIEQAWNQNNEGGDKKAKEPKQKPEPTMLEIKEECEYLHSRESIPTKKFVIEDSETPLKKPIKKIVTEDVDANTLMPPKSELAKRVEADRSCNQSVFSATCTDIDDQSSYMCSQAGSPFKKARRTRDERRNKNKAKENSQQVEHTSPQKHAFRLNQNLENQIRGEPLKTPTKQESPMKTQINILGNSQMRANQSDLTSSQKKEQFLCVSGQKSNRKVSVGILGSSLKENSAQKELFGNMLTASKDREHHILSEEIPKILIE